jgi:hypothetical protein
VITGNTCVGDDDIESAESIDAFGDGGIERILITNIGHMGDDAATFLFNQPSGFSQVFFGGGLVGDIGKDWSAGVDGDDVGALGGETAGVSSTLAPGGAGDQYDFVFKPTFVATHGSPSSRLGLHRSIPASLSYYL